MKNKLLALICVLTFHPYCLILGQIWEQVEVEYNIDEFFHDLTWYITYEGDTIAHGGNQVGTPYQYIISPQRRRFFIPQEGCVNLIITESACLGFYPAMSGALYNLRLMRLNGEVIHQVGPAEFNEQTGCMYTHIINLSNPGAECPEPPDPPSTCLGDLNSDGTVGIIDLIIFIVQYGTNCN